MLETMEGAKLCGIIEYNDTWCDVYCDKDGVLAFDNYTDGTWCITEVNVAHPIDLDTTLGLIHNMENNVYGTCCGVIYTVTGDIIVLLDETTAVKRKVWKPSTDVGEKFYYSTDEEYTVE